MSVKFVSFLYVMNCRYCMAVNVIGFAYSGLQVYDLVHYFTTGKQLVRHHLRHYFDFFIDQASLCFEYLF
jgi:hypothetical protein